VTTLQVSLHAADRPVGPPRFDAGLSAAAGGLTTGDPGVSPGWTRTSWASWAWSWTHITGFLLPAMCVQLRWTHVAIVFKVELLL
jgi:hypothetical protein